MLEQAMQRLLVLGPPILVALFLSLELVVLLRPHLARLAPAWPSERSSHRGPTPQGAGVAVVVATLAVTWGAVFLSRPLPAGEVDELLALTLAAAFLTLIGMLDDIKPLPITIRLIGQFVAIGTVIAALPGNLQIAPELPWFIERFGLLLGALWFVNLVNFMDGIDWMTVAELVPVTGALALLGPETLGWLPAILAAALLGGTLGFAPFNKPVAQLFLGDGGSLPIGLLLGWLMLQLAAHGHFAAAIILPMYYLADASLTLARRMIRREPFWQPHRTHFYQLATDNGLTVPQVIARVFALNLILAALAVLSVASGDRAVSLLALSTAAICVAYTLSRLARGKG